MASGTATINFGAFPGTPEVELDVSGQTGLVATSRIEAWVLPIATADHSADEHKSESLEVKAFYKVDGTFTIRGWDNSPPPMKRQQNKISRRHILYGQFSVGWAWSNT